MKKKNKRKENMNEIEKLQNEIGVLDEKLDYLVSYNKISESGEKSWNYKINGKRRRLSNLIKKPQTKGINDTNNKTIR